MYTPQNSPAAGRLELIFRSSSSLHHFDHLRQPEQVYKLPVSTQQHGWSKESEVVFTVCAALQVMILETTGFLNQCSDELKSLVSHSDLTILYAADPSQRLASRQNPTSDKVKFLLHFEDCRVSAQEGVHHGLQVLRSFTAWVDQLQRDSSLWNGGESLWTRFARIRMDLEFLDTELSRLKPDIRELQQMIREQLALNNERRTFILTVLAAIFLPLSFATSLCGMNMSPAISEGPADFSKWMRATVNNIRHANVNDPLRMVAQPKSLVHGIGNQTRSFGGDKCFL